MSHELRAPTALSTLETPTPIVDLDRLAHNLDRMAAYAAVNSVRLRPHVKTHKSRRMAAEQLRLGAAGLTCATPRELEVMAGVADDLLLAYPPVGAIRARRVAETLPDGTLTVMLDSALAADQLATAARAVGRTIRVLVEVDMGMHRVGVAHTDDAVALATHVARTKGLEYAGIGFYPGHIRERVDQYGGRLAKLGADIDQLATTLDHAGLTPQVVSGSSTPIAWHAHELPRVTELRPGTYIYNDRTTAMIGACAWDDCALTVLATVVSTSVDGQAVIDAGSKALGREPLRSGTATDEKDGWGALLDRPDVVVSRMSEEHGVLDLSRTEWRPSVGDLVRVVPNHVCYVVALFDDVFGVRGEHVETLWPVDARGRMHRLHDESVPPTPFTPRLA
jgi:D-serine deaminase-like pyridoxal phosphate-dependent protein